MRRNEGDAEAALAAWREAERRLKEAAEADGPIEELAREADRLRAEFRKLDRRHIPRTAEQRLRRRRVS